MVCRAADGDVRGSVTPEQQAGPFGAEAGLATVRNAVRGGWDDGVMAQHAASDYLKDPDFTDPACVAAWEEWIDELKRAEMGLEEANRTWLSVSSTLVLARLQLGLVSERGAAPITIRRAAALADRAERRSLTAWGRLELARCE